MVSATADEYDARLCAPFTRDLKISGAALSTLGDLVAPETVCASDGNAAHLDELQFDLGEGPCWDAVSNQRPVLEDDVRDAPRGTWPAFIDAIQSTPVRAMFAFPLTLGPLHVGAVDLYRKVPGQLADGEYARAVGLAATAARLVLRRILLSLSEPADTAAPEILPAAVSPGDGSGDRPTRRRPRGRRTHHPSTRLFDWQAGAGDLRRHPGVPAGFLGRGEHRAGLCARWRVVRHTEEDARESTLLESFAMLADNLVTGYDPIDLLQTLVERCQAVLDASEAGILLQDERGQLDVVAATAERVRLIELLQLDPDGGPCAECFRTGRPVLIPEMDEIDPRWSRFGAIASREGILSVYCVPLRLRRQTIGSLNLFSEHAGMPPELDQVAAQAMADVATISILQRREAQEGELIREQLQQALDSRVLIEQAKGVVSYQRRIPVDQAFQLIRSYARNNRERLDDVARRIVGRDLDL